MEAITALHTKLQEATAELEELENELFQTKLLREEIETKSKQSKDDIAFNQELVKELTQQKKVEKAKLDELKKENVNLKNQNEILEDKISSVKDITNQLQIDYYHKYLSTIDSTNSVYHKVISNDFYISNIISIQSQIQNMKESYRQKSGDITKAHIEKDDLLTNQIKEEERTMVKLKQYLNDLIKKKIDIETHMIITPNDISNLNKNIHISHPTINNNSNNPSTNTSNSYTTNSYINNTNTNKKPLNDNVTTTNEFILSNNWDQYQDSCYNSYPSNLTTASTSNPALNNNNISTNINTVKIPMNNNPGYTARNNNNNPPPPPPPTIQSQPYMNQQFQTPPPTKTTIIPSSTNSNQATHSCINNTNNMNNNNSANINTTTVNMYANSSQHQPVRNDLHTNTMNATTSTSTTVPLSTEQMSSAPAAVTVNNHKSYQPTQKQPTTTFPTQSSQNQTFPTQSSQNQTYPLVTNTNNINNNTATTTTTTIVSRTIIEEVTK